MAKEPVEGREPEVSNDIDDRMAALLKDHIEMGARPKTEPVSVDATTEAPPAEEKPATKKAAAKK